ncbi:MAG: lytic transglycosylase domain-containing protein, partial [Chloroflexota bacterium]|nr:lytic transglycosylase domain-containing protein [Chloroflexota bacterium]
LRSLVKESADFPLSLYQLALSFRQMGLTRLSILCVEKLIEFSLAEAIDDVPIFLQQLAYPLRFDDLVMSESQANGLDPFLLLALIRQESRFDEHATSRAGARGLTQIIPATGEWIALKLGRRGYRADDLYRPCLNVRFGAWYLAQQFEKFDGDILAALAAYNSGPNRARRWFEKAAGDDDLLLETIPLAEPRLFASKVYEQYAVYRFLYGKVGVRSTGLSPSVRR